MKPNDAVRWAGGDGILKHGQKYLVWKTKEGLRGQEIALKYSDWQMVEPITWFHIGSPFVAVSPPMAETRIQKEAA